MARKNMQKPENCFIPIAISQAFTLNLEPPKMTAYGYNWWIFKKYCYLPLHKQVQKLAAK